jgi:BirA family transcriptional regulator, biotin operon repressor / biotin---[acetyl-CoA-carboxylase] ligase
LLESMKGSKVSRLLVRDPIWLKTVDSTQRFVGRELRNSREGQVVISDVQTAGEGRENRKWFSPPGGMWLTIVLQPPLPEILEKIPLMATTSIVGTLESFGLAGCFIKLPNDVICQGKKIAGVLADASVIGTSTKVFLGMGININNDPSEIPEISGSSTSFKLMTGTFLDLIEFGVGLILNLDFQYMREIERS